MTDGVESAPEGLGADPAALDRAVDLVRARGAVAQLCVLRRGEVVLDRTFGCAPDALFWVFSASKPFTALLVHLLAERGQLDLDDAVSRYWPEFGQRGKQDITVRQVLQHRAGLPVVRSMNRDALAATSWRRSVRAIERARPSLPPGQGPAYHVLSYGFILGELVQRVTHAHLRDVLRTELLDPLGLVDTHLGLPDALWPRHVPVRVEGRRRLIGEAAFNLRATRQAVIPAAGISTTARDLARFYEMLRRGGELDGVRVLATSTVAEATTPSSDGEIDRYLKVPIRWSQGFQLGGSSRDPLRPGAMGRLSSATTFGHNGSNSCVAWADPGRELAFAYLTNLLPGGVGGSPHQSDVSDAVLSACD
jgi:CubicO group peptidase (beta-lactamase class C family)